VDTETDLEALSSRQLHDLAVHRALHRADVGFFWELLRAIPAAETLEGDEREAGEDLTKVSALLSDALTSGDGDLAEALRPLYLDYLRKHPKLARNTPRLPGRSREPGGAGRRSTPPFGLLESSERGTPARARRARPLTAGLA
jgi:hypothetical protein